MKKLAEDMPCIDIGDIKSILAGEGKAKTRNYNIR